MSTIEEGDFIKLSYTGKLEDDTVFDTTSEEVAKEEDIFNENATYGGDIIVVGAGHVVEGLDEALVGKDLGYEGTVEVPPEKGFGPSRPDLVKTVSVKQFEEKPYPGQRVVVSGQPGTVETVIGRRARVNFNHPLAGKTLTYKFKIEAKIVDPVESLKGLLKLYTGETLNASIEDDVAKVEIPLHMTFDQRWLMNKRRVADEIISRLDVDEVRFVEKFTSLKQQLEEAKKEKEE